MINHLWQCTVFTAAVGLLTLAFHKNRAQVRFWLWFSASLKFFVPFSLLVSLGSQVEWAPAAEQVAARNVSVTIVQIAQPFPVSSPLAASTSGQTDWLAIAIPGVWLCGFLYVALIRLQGWIRIRAAVRSSAPIDIPAPVEVRSSAGVLEPGVVGLWRPTLLLPTGIGDRLTPPQLEAVLVHELCHIRRRDNLVASIHMVAEAVFWFHPLVWWIGARLVEERERACDEAVLSLGGDPRVYAEAIVNVCKLYVESPLACVSGVTGSDLKKRIEAIMTNRIVLRLNSVKKIVLASVGIGVLALPIIVGMMNAPAIEAQSTAPRPKFDVVSVKSCKDEPGRMKGAGNSSPGRLSTGCSVLVDENNLGLVQRAYVRFAGGHTNPIGILPIKGGPPWIHSVMFDINAKAEGNPSREMMQGPMLQTLLEDRFKLKIHREAKQNPVYALTLIKEGPGLKPFQDGSCVQRPWTFPVPELGHGQKYCKSVMIAMGATPSMDGEGNTLGEFSKMLNLVLDRPVIDQTGITRRFNIHLEFARDQATPGLREPNLDPSAQASDPTGRPTIFTAIQQQLGLKLVPARGPVEFLVIDHIEKPSPN